MNQNERKLFFEKVSSYGHANEGNGEQISSLGRFCGFKQRNMLYDVDFCGKSLSMVMNVIMSL